MNGVVFLAVVAFFIIYKLFKVLGREDDSFKEDKTTASHWTNLFGTFKEEATAEKQMREIKIVSDEKATFSDEIDSVFREANKMKSSVSVQRFMIGVRKSFQMIVEAFAQGDKDTLRHLLSAKLANDFILMIDDRMQKKDVLENKVVGINSINIIQAELRDMVLTVVVEIKSDQIRVLYDQNGVVKNGHPDMISLFTDLCDFTTNLSKDEIWFLTSIK